jgi:osmotically-inducible protein OsmY
MLVTSWAIAASEQAAQPQAANPQAPEMQPQGSNSVSPAVQAKINKGISRALIMLPYSGVFDWITATVQGRNVTLGGQVLRSSLKPDAEHAVKKVEGVDNVVNNIEVLPPGQIDQRIRQQVYNAIYNYPALQIYGNDKVNPPIHIIVKSARVTLEGVVNTEVDKNLCTMRVNQVSDVLSVTNNLRVVKG